MGLAYRSEDLWATQLNHWRSRQQVIFQEKQVLLRSMDTRILSQLLPAMIICRCSMSNIPPLYPRKHREYFIFII
ncbi:DUF4123 domain-containing protein [Photorhabdus temperata]|uniref:DUF4123 domain-containing protein n=1 Tax=Photorhabdus temperata TaxID=574560 RepID=UPI000A89D994|nr:DUF4123 domain-containing protein [Photorhabdus temperata]